MNEKIKILKVKGARPPVVRGALCGRTVGTTHATVLLRGFTPLSDLHDSCDMHKKSKLSCCKNAKFITVVVHMILWERHRRPGIIPLARRTGMVLTEERNK